MLTALLLVGLVLTAPPDPIRVFVVAPVATHPSGFSEPRSKDRADSVRDLQREIRKKRKTLALAESREQADVVLEVLGRGIASEADGGVIAVPLGRSVIAQPTYRSANVVRTRLVVGDYERPIVGAFDGIGDVWSECAEQITKDLDAWIAENRAQLLARRPAK